MRILALGAKGLVLPSIHDSMVRAFESLGHDVIGLPISAVSRRPDPLIPEAKDGRCDAAFILDLGGDREFISRLWEIQESLRIPWLIWFLDDPEGHGFPEACHPDWTLAFCWDQGIVAQSLGWHGMPLTHLPLATDPSLFYPGPEGCGCLYPSGVFVGSTAHPNPLLESVAKSTPGFLQEVERLWGIHRSDFRKPLYDLAWKRASRIAGKSMASIRQDPVCRLWVHACVHQLGMRKRKEVVAQVLGPLGAVFGDPGWESALAAGMYRGSVPYGEGVREIYSQSPFVLEVRQPQARTGLTQRIFDAAACGRAVVAEWSPEMEMLFGPEELLWFRNISGALEARDRCLRDPTASCEMGQRAGRRVLAHHTFRHRAARMLAALRQI